MERSGKIDTFALARSFAEKLRRRTEPGHKNCFMKILSLALFSVLMSAHAIAQSHSGNNTAMVPTVTCDTVLQTSTCAGGNVIVPFTVTGGNFTFGNVFTAQLSNQFGQFTAPVNIGSIPWIASGIIFATIPSNANFSFFYRIRIIASNPMDTSNVSPNPIFVTQVAQLNQIVAAPHNYVCPGDTITLTAINIASSYSWSTGDTTMNIQVTQPGIYSVTTTDQLTCQSTTADTLYTSCTGVEETLPGGLLSVFPNPASGHFYICLKSEKYTNAVISIHSVLGNEVYHEKLNIGMGKNEELDISRLDRGMYFISINVDGVHAVKKIIVN
jgi:hypothetical protein